MEGINLVLSGSIAVMVGGILIGLKKLKQLRSKS
jgi:hypothetical protein